MLAIDVPISALAGLVLTDAGRNMLRSGNRREYNFMRVTVLLYSLVFITPIPFYFFLGWPAWETNFLWTWPDHMLDSPVRAAGVSFGVFLLTVGPAYVGFQLGKVCVRKGRDRIVRVAYVSLAVLVGVIIYLTRDVTFNIASTQARFQAKEFYSFWSHPFFTGWLIVTVYFWGSLFVFYVWLRRRDKAAGPSG